MDQEGRFIGSVYRALRKAEAEAPSAGKSLWLLSDGQHESQIRICWNLDHSQNNFKPRCSLGSDPKKQRLCSKRNTDQPFLHFCSPIYRPGTIRGSTIIHKVQLCTFHVSKCALNSLYLVKDIHNNCTRFIFEQWVVLPPHGARVAGWAWLSFVWNYRCSPMSTWVSSGFYSLLPPPKNLPVGGLAVLRCP